jgi:formate dehydrogenase iron-sulfur subunit
MSSHGLLIDITKCVGCGQCHEACAQANGNPTTPPETLSDQSWTAVLDKGNDVYVRRLCMHCVEPACASVCPVAALHKTPNGPVLYDESRCMGCRYCMVACPYQVPKYEWSSRVPRVRKCIMCAPRLAQGKPTACSEACPTGATKFGDQEALMEEAQNRIREAPETYGSRVFGLREAGGTSVLFLAPKSVDFAALGFPDNLPGEPLPELTYRVLSKIPNFAVVGAAALFGIHWIIGRRMELAREGAAAEVTEGGTGGAGAVPLGWMEKYLTVRKDLTGKQRQGEEESCSTIQPLG